MSNHVPVIIFLYFVIIITFQTWSKRICADYFKEFKVFSSSIISTLHALFRRCITKRQNKINFTEVCDDFNRETRNSKDIKFQSTKVLQSKLNFLL